MPTAIEALYCETFSLSASHKMPLQRMKYNAGTEIRFYFSWMNNISASFYGDSAFGDLIMAFLLKLPISLWVVALNIHFVFYIA